MPLPVDVEHHVAALGQRLLDRRARRAVAAAEHVGPFQQLAAGDQRLELGRRAEVIVAAVPLALARRAGGYADRRQDARVALAEQPRDRGLAGTGRRRKHEAYATAS